MIRHDHGISRPAATLRPGILAVSAFTGFEPFVFWMYGGF